MRPIIIISLLFFIVLSSGCLSSVHSNEGYTDVVVTKKFIDYSKEEGSHYLLTTTKGMFEVDRPLFDTFNQSRNPDLVYSGISENKSYRLYHYGYRVDWLYEYPIVVDVIEIK